MKKKGKMLVQYIVNSGHVYPKYTCIWLSMYAFILHSMKIETHDFAIALCFEYAQNGENPKVHKKNWAI